MYTETTKIIRIVENVKPCRSKKKLPKITFNDFLADLEMNYIQISSLKI